MKKASKELIYYITQFEQHAKECLDAGLIEMFMIYDYDCETCQMEFNHFKNFLGISFDDTMTVRGKENFDMIACRLMPVNVRSRLGKKLVAESEAWASANKNPDLVIKFKPTYIDAVTHEKKGFGFIPYKPLRDMLNLNKLPARRRNFKKTYTQKLGRECDGVACGIKSRVKTKANK